MPPFNDDDYDVGPDAVLGLSTDVEDEYRIQKVHTSGAKHRITLQLSREWAMRMGLKNHDHIVLRLSSDWKEIAFRKLPDYRFRSNTVPMTADSDIAALLDEQQK
jgi:hypothetical protein